jgi:hypothetical protein
MNWLYELAVCHAVECLRGHGISFDDAKRQRQCAHDVKPAVNLLEGSVSCPAGIIEMLADQDVKRECFAPGMQLCVAYERYR